MSNKILANFIIGSLVLCVIAGISEPESPAFAEILFSISGLMYLIFGIWGSVRLYKTK